MVGLKLNDDDDFCFRETFKKATIPSLDRLFLLQCESGNVNKDLIDCARYNISNEYSQLIQANSPPVHFVLVIHLPRTEDQTFVGFQVIWKDNFVYFVYDKKKLRPPSLKKLR